MSLRDLTRRLLVRSSMRASVLAEAARCAERGEPYRPTRIDDWDDADLWVRAGLLDVTGRQSGAYRINAAGQRWLDRSVRS